RSGDGRGDRSTTTGTRGARATEPARAARGRPVADPEPRVTPLSVYLPFNREALGGAFAPAKRATKAPESRQGYWLVVHEQSLLVAREGDRFRLPQGDPRPASKACGSRRSGSGRSTARRAGCWRTRGAPPCPPAF